MSGTVREWSRLECGCRGTYDALIISEDCDGHKALLPEGDFFDQYGEYGPVDIDDLEGLA